MDLNEVSSVRIRFLSDLRKDYYIQVSEVRCINQEKTELSLYENVSKEREIFLRASLQLLDLKESNRHKDRVAPSRYHSTVQSKQVKSSEDENKMHDVIRLGFLKKGSNSNSLSMSGNFRWKTKYVELRHGLFAYSDCSSGRSLKDLAQSDSSISSNKRFIELNSENCECHTLLEDPTFNAGFENNSCIFVISIKGGSRRYWMASNADECKEWVRNIRSAVLGTSMLHQHHDHKHFQEASNHFPRGSLTRNDSDGESCTNDDSGEVIVLEEKTSFTATSSLSTWLSIEGAAAPYTRNMSLYLELRSSFGSSCTEKEYKKRLRDMFKEGFRITIPVLFVKSKSSENSFLLSAQDSLTSHNFIGKDCSSQIWKDLQRDKIVIDGDEVTGELGAEAMVGALVRHISEKAEAIKSMEEGNHRDIREVFTSNQSFPYHHHHNPFVSKFSVNDAQIVECARDLLVLCNRTQSGGDTYFCVDALFRGENSKEICLLAPLSPEAEPLNFKVDLVEIHKEHVPSLHRKSYHPKDGKTTSTFRGMDRGIVRYDIDVENQPSPGTSLESKVRFDFSDTTTVALYDARTPHADPGTSHFHDTVFVPASGVDENRRKPQLNLTEILEQDGFLLGLRRQSEPPPLEDPTRHNVVRRSLKLDELSSNSKSLEKSVLASTDGNMERNQASKEFIEHKTEMPSQLLVSSSKDDQSVVSELTFDTFFRQGNRDPHYRPYEGMLSGIHEQAIVTSGEEDTQNSNEKSGSSSRDNLKNKSLLDKIGKRLKLPKLADLEGLNSPFARRRPSMKSESSGDERTYKLKQKNENFDMPVQFEHSSNTLLKPSDAKSEKDTSNHRAMCIRVQVQAKSRFKLCTLNPSGVEELDTWATISGIFYQSFYIVGDGSGHLGIADRLVTIHVDSIYHPTSFTSTEEL